MTAEPQSASLVSRFAVSEVNKNIPQGYYRSKLFVNTSTTNPLVAASGPIMSVLERLCISPSLPPIESIRANIEHEWHAFHSRLASYHYAEEFVAIASYLLCATIDELLGKNYLRVYGKPAEFNAFTPLSNDNVGPQHRFFEIVGFIKSRANQYLDLIELAYYCLIAGFEGEHHLRADGRQTLDNLIEELYQLIQQHRANKPHKLFNDKATLMPQPQNHKRVIASVLIGVAVLFSVFFISHAVLEYKAKTVLRGHSLLAKLDN